MTLSQQVAAPLAEAHGAAVFHLPWQDLLSVVPRCDAVIVDAPYSEKTHKGHGAALCDDMRRDISYQAWGAAEVRTFVEAWHPRCDGWIVSITDHVLAPEWPLRPAPRAPSTVESPTPRPKRVRK